MAHIDKCCYELRGEFRAVVCEMDEGEFSYGGCWKVEVAFELVWWYGFFSKVCSVKKVEKKVAIGVVGKFMVWKEGE